MTSRWNYQADWAIVFALIALVAYLNAIGDENATEVTLLVCGGVLALLRGD
jgi:hypothetical protein